MPLLSTFFGANDSLFTNINKFQSISNILHSFLDLFCDWLCTSHMIHLEPWRVHSNAFCINDTTYEHLNWSRQIPCEKSFQTVHGLPISTDPRVWLLRHLEKGCRADTELKFVVLYLTFTR